MERGEGSRERQYSTRRSLMLYCGSRNPSTSTIIPPTARPFLHLLIDCGLRRRGKGAAHCRCQVKKCPPTNRVIFVSLGQKTITPRLSRSVKLYGFPKPKMTLVPGKQHQKVSPIKWFNSPLLQSGNHTLLCPQKVATELNQKYATGPKSSN